MRSNPRHPSIWGSSDPAPMDGAPEAALNSIARDRARRLLRDTAHRRRFRRALQAGTFTAPLLVRVHVLVLEVPILGLDGRGSVWRTQYITGTDVCKSPATIVRGAFVLFEHSVLCGMWACPIPPRTFAPLPVSMDLVTALSLIYPFQQPSEQPSEALRNLIYRPMRPSPSPSSGR